MSKCISLFPNYIINSDTVCKKKGSKTFMPSPQNAVNVKISSKIKLKRWNYNIIVYIAV